MTTISKIVFFTSITILCACVQQTIPQEVITNKIQVNQIGFTAESSKMAAVPCVTASTFSIIETLSGKTAYRGELTKAQLWAPSQELVKKADFSALRTPGSYTVEASGCENSYPFSIGTHPYGDVHDAAIKAYYFNRASSALSKTHAGQYARPLGHPDTHIRVHASAANTARPAGTIISAPKGWYDAGDYNKYIVNSGISTYTLLAAYLRSPEFYGSRTWNIPESNDNVPDILNEVMWNLDWMQAMQDPNDGGVYNKLTTLGFSGGVMPDKANGERYVVAKGTAAALNFAAVMAVASRTYAPFQKAYPNKSQQYKAAALAAWKWAQANSNLPFENPKDVSTGGYGDTSFNDEFSWAAAELYLLTHEQQYLDRFLTLDKEITVPEWANVEALGYISLSQHGRKILPQNTLQKIDMRIVNLVNKIAKSHLDSGYGVAMDTNNFVWGSNAVALNRALIALEGYRINGTSIYLKTAQSLVDYVMGRNPTGYSFITGFGSKPPMGIHHRPSYADGIDAPIPGWLAGGPQNGHQDDCKYTSKHPATSYVDDWCSYSTNEITINWNAPLVYVLSVLN